MAKIAYADTKQVRALLGVSELEISDAALTDAGVGALVLARMTVWYPNHAAAIAAGDGISPPDVDVQLADNVRLLCAYEVAIQFLPQLQTLIWKSMSDGDFQQTRFGEIAELKASILAQRDEIRGLLNPEFFGLIPFLHLSGSAPSYDPVAGY